MDYAIATASLAVAVAMLWGLCKLSSMFNNWKNNQCEKDFWKNAAAYEAAGSVSDENSPNGRWASDVRRLLKLNALPQDQIGKLQELGIATTEEIKQAADTPAPVYSFNKATFIVAFAVPLALSLYAIPCAINASSGIAVAYALTSLAAIAAMVFLGMVDQKGHMIPFEVWIPLSVVSIAYAVVVIMAGICQLEAFAVGFGIALAVFFAPYLVMSKMFSTAPFGKGDVLALPSYALLVAPLPFVGLIATCVPMLVSVIVSHIGTGIPKSMPMGPFLAFGACITISAALVVVFWG